MGWFSTAAGVLKSAAPTALTVGAGVGLPYVIEALLGGDSDASTVGNTKKDPTLGDLYFAGKNYGYQTPESFLKIIPSAATGDPREQDRIKAIQNAMLQDIARAKAAATPPAQQEIGTPSSTTSGTTSSTTGGSAGQSTERTLPAPETKPPGQTQDATIGELIKALQKMQSPEEVAKRAEIDTENAIRRSLVTSALSLRQSKENTKRQVELENIQAWRNLEQEKIRANTAQTVNAATSIAFALTPNQSYAQAMNEAFRAGLAPYTNFTVK